MKDISGFSVMPAMCESCPFGPSGDLEIRATVQKKLLNGSQICHHPRLHGKKQTHLCRGARDEQLQAMHKLKVITEPTDDAWDAARKELGV